MKTRKGWVRADGKAIKLDKKNGSNTPKFEIESGYLTISGCAYDTLDKDEVKLLMRFLALNYPDNVGAVSLEDITI